MTDKLKYEQDGHVVTVTLNQPDTMNAITDPDMVQGLVDTMTRLTQDNSVRCAIITGAGKAFSSGGNLKHMADKTGLFAGDAITAKDGYKGGIQRMDHDGLRWVVGLAVPEQAVMGRVRTLRNATFGVALFGGLGVVGLGLLVSAPFNRGIQDLELTTRAVGQFKLDPSPVPKTLVREVAALAEAVEDMKRGLRAFKKYVPTPVVRAMLASGQEAELGGERKRLSIFFADIEGFSGYAETLEPERLVHVLGAYLDQATEDVHRYDGTVDKFIGDAVMAFWNAPLPQPNHALQACRAALAHQRALDGLRWVWVAEGLPGLRVRIGLHSGDAVVGNLGSAQRLAYTAIGDAVNLASRLESLNRFYGSQILISEALYLEVQDKVVARPLDRVAVKGRAQPVGVYELLALADEASDPLLDQVERFRAAYGLYRERAFEEAAEILHEILEVDPTDTVAAGFLSRVEAFAQSPPPADWDGIRRMSSK